MMPAVTEKAEAEFVRDWLPPKPRDMDYGTYFECAASDLARFNGSTSRQAKGVIIRNAPRLYAMVRRERRKGRRA